MCCFPLHAVRNILDVTQPVFMPVLFRHTKYTLAPQFERHGCRFTVYKPRTRRTSVPSNGIVNKLCFPLLGCIPATQSGVPSYFHRDSPCGKCSMQPHESSRLRAFAAGAPASP